MSLFDTISDALREWAAARKPNVTIGSTEDPYMYRWFRIPKNALFNMYVHYFMRSDDDRALHDHPHLFNISIILWGSYVEHTILPGGIHVKTHRSRGGWKFRWGQDAHRIELVDGPCWTLFISGPRTREWGFLCPFAGWVHWKEFTATDAHGASIVGRGCGEA